MARREGSGVASVAGLLGELQDTERMLCEARPAGMTALMNETSPMVAALLQKSTDYLDEETRECFAHLGAFESKPATFGLKYMAKTWEVPESEAQPIADRLIDHGLLESVGDGRFWLHALLVDSCPR